MTEYVAQLEYDAGEVHRPEWRQVARSDTSHDFFHIDVHYVDGEKDKRMERSSADAFDGGGVQVRERLFRAKRVYSTERDRVCRLIHRRSTR